MKINSRERGQALIIIAFAAVGLFAFASLAIDGSMALSDKRHAQNAADSAALAAALAHARNENITLAATNRATSNGYNDNETTNNVTVTIVDAPNGVCPANTTGKDITVDIVTTINTSLARVFGRNTITSAVTATSRACGSYTGPPFDGNAIVALAPSGKAFEGTGTPDWNITGGGIYSNSSSSNAAYCNGAADISAPSVTVVGDTDFNCHGVNIPGGTTTGATQYPPSSMTAFFPRQPACDGTASHSGSNFSPEAGTDGSQVSLPTSNGTWNFAPGLYCVTNSSTFNIHGDILGANVTFYFMASNFTMKYNGGGNLTATAPTSGEYEGVLIFVAPQYDANGNLIDANQNIDMRGNGTGNVVGAIIAPSADVTMFGNSGTGAFNSQIIAYHIDSGGNSNINISYNPDDNYQSALPITLTMLK